MPLCFFAQLGCAVIADGIIFDAVGQVGQELRRVNERLFSVSLPFWCFYFFGRTSYVGALMFANVGS